MPVYRAKILVPKYVAVEAATSAEAAPALQQHAALLNGLLTEIEPIPARIIEEPVASPPGGEAA